MVPEGDDGTVVGTPTEGAITVGETTDGVPYGIIGDAATPRSPPQQGPAPRNGRKVRSLKARNRPPQGPAQFPKGPGPDWQPAWPRAASASTRRTTG